jgi:uncharacterized protein GlcG (DUF336 family)
MPSKYLAPLLLAASAGTAFVSVAAVAAVPPVSADAAVDRKAAAPLTLDQADALARAARSACQALGREIAVGVVDASGQTLLLTRSAAVGPHNLEAARRKAFTALSTRQSTLLLGRQARSQPDTAALQYLPELLLLGGGVPLMQGSTVLGAVGVAGGGGPENDDRCARAAVEAFPGVRQAGP